MNSGDMFAQPDTLQTVANALTANPEIDVLYGDSCHRDREGHINYRHALDAPLVGPNKTVIQHMTCSHQSVYYNVDTIGDQRYDTALPVCADYPFTMAVLQKSKHTHLIRKPLALSEPKGVSARCYGKVAKDMFLARQNMGMSFVDNATSTLRTLGVGVLRDVLPKKMYSQVKSLFRANTYSALPDAERPDILKPLIPLVD